MASGFPRQQQVHWSGAIEEQNLEEAIEEQNLEEATATLKRLRTEMGTVWHPFGKMQGPKGQGTMPVNSGLWQIGTPKHEQLENEHAVMCQS